MKYACIILCLTIGLGGLAQDFSLHINKSIGTFVGHDVVCCAFNDDTIFDFKNSIVHVLPGTYSFEVFNHDSLSHTFTIDGLVESDNVILPGDSAEFMIDLTDIGTKRFYSNQPYGVGLGASGHILVGYDNYDKYYWNLFDLDSAMTYELNAGAISEVPSSYQPELFFINGEHFPETLEDPDAYAQAQVGDTLIISVVNSGHMDHVLHFHGFHAEILGAEIMSSRVGWVKDSFPLKIGETMTLMLIPDKEGTYPVHDHNLIAVTNAGFYPGGMLTHLVIDP